jgi:hypothetical protein
MNRKLILSLVAAMALALFLFACSGDGDAEGGVGPGATASPIDTKASLQLTVKDTSSGTLIAGATVTLLATNESKTTTASGSVVFSGLESGTHSVRIDAPGYASLVGELPVGASTGAGGGVFIAGETAYQVYLYHASAALRGYVFYTDSARRVVPLANATVRITFQNSALVENAREVKTNGDGLYEFKGLPAAANRYSLLAIFDNFNTHQICNVGFCQALLKETEVVQAVSTYSTSNASATVFQVSDYTKVVGETEPVVFTFSDNVNTSLITRTTVDVGSQIANLEWVDGKTLRISPVTKWSAVATGTFNVSFAGLANTGHTLLSVNGKALAAGSFTGNYVVTVEKADLSAVGVTLWIPDSLGIDYSTASVTLKWNKVADADKGYKIFAQYKDTEPYEEVTGLYIATANDTTATVTFKSENGSNAIRDRKVSFKVQALNTSYESNLALATARTAKDVVPPNYDFNYNNFASSDSVVQFYSNTYGNLYASGFTSNYALNSRLTSTAASPNFAVGRIIFSKPMDTTATLSAGFTDSTGTAGVVVNGAAANVLAKKLLIKPVWLDEQILTLEVSTAADAVPAEGAVNVVWSLSGLKSKKDEAFKTDYPAGAAANNSKVNIRFTASTTPPGPCDDPTSSTCASWCALNSNGTLETGNCSYWCSSSGYSDYSKCPVNYCSNNGSSDYTNCPTEACANNADNAACVTYCSNITNYLASAADCSSQFTGFCSLNASDDLCRDKSSEGGDDCVNPTSTSSCLCDIYSSQLSSYDCED